ncbi:MAG: hypothetical protein ABIH38_04475 [Patescibacteria group bacterium]
MLILFCSITLFVLFIGLGYAAAKLVDNVKIISLKLGAPLFVIGLVLGFFTSLPELSIGFNAVADGYFGLPIGNLYGGIIVMFCLILGLSAVLNKRISTDGHFRSVTPFIVFIMFALILGLKGRYGWYDGLLFCFIYLGLIYFTFRKNQRHLELQTPVLNQKKVATEIFYVIAGAVAVIILSDLIVRVTELLLAQVNIRGLTLGLLVFSIGTNLPELSVALTSWRKHAAELSLSHLLGSAVCNMLIIGILSLFKTLYFPVDASYYALIVLIGLSLFLFMRFYKTDKMLSRREGLVLLGVYLLFVISQIVLLK